MTVDARNKDFSALNEEIRHCKGDCEIINCLGQRYIGAGLSEKRIEIRGVPGNALGAYLNGASISVNGNAQDAVGDTMNAGSIVIHGNIGDAAGYAMRGGEILVWGNAGYRAGIHMKAYEEKKPLMMIGGCAGSFLGEYQAGGVIVVLGLFRRERPIVGNFPCTGMHGGKMILRESPENLHLPEQVHARRATKEDMEEIRRYAEKFCAAFKTDLSELMNAEFTVITPNSKNPYKQMYVAN